MNYQKNILVITHAGGSSKYGPNMRWYNFGLALKKYNIKTTILASSYFHKYVRQPKVEKLFTNEFINQIEYIWIKTKIYKKGGFNQVLNQIEFISKCLLMIKKVFLNKPSTIIASSPHPLVIFPAFIFSRLTSAKLIFESRDLWPEILFQLDVLRKVNPYYWLLKFSELFAVLVSDYIVSVKKGEFQYYKKKYNLKKSKFIYLANSYFHEKSLFEDVSFEVKKFSEKVLKCNKFILSYVGALSTYYNIESIIGLAEKAKKDKLNVLFLIVGDGEIFDYLKQKIQELDLDNINLLGKLKRPDAHQILRISSAGYVSIRDLEIHDYGISCNKIYEYMYYSLPILGHYNTAYDPVVEAKCGLVSDPKNNNQLFKNLKFMAENPTILKDMALKSNSYYINNHCTELVVKKLLDLL